MKWDFNSINVLKEFAEYISKTFDSLGEAELAKEVSDFTYNSFTTSSEYLGEYRILLQKIIQEKKNKIDNELYEDIQKAINAINKAFSS